MDLENLKTLAESLPEDVKANALALVEEMGTVIEGIGDDPVPWKPSFLRLVQGTTDRSSLPKGTGIGDFVIGEKKVDQPLEIIPLRFWDARQYWDPDQTNAKMLCNSPDAKKGYYGQDCKSCEYGKWKEEENKGSDCNKIKSGMFITSDLRTLFTINFAKSSYKAGMELEGFMKKAGVLPYRRTYGLTNTPSATAKNVEIFKVELLPEAKRNTATDKLDFLKAIFDAVGGDRKVMLDKFYELALVRKDNNPLLSNSSGGSDSNLVIEGSATTQAQLEAPAAGATKAGVSSMAKSYSV